MHEVFNFLLPDGLLLIYVADALSPSIIFLRLRPDSRTAQGGLALHILTNETETLDYIGDPNTGLVRYSNGRD